MGLRREGNQIEIWARRHGMVAVHRLPDVSDLPHPVTGRPWAEVMSAAVISLDDALKCRAGEPPEAVRAFLDAGTFERRLQMKTERESLIEAVVEVALAGASEKELRKLASGAGCDDAIIEEALRRAGEEPAARG